MLDGLDDVSWGDLVHAYGSAGDVPDQIRALTSDDPSVRDRAVGDLYSNIFHQGTRYEAAKYAVRFLVELASSPAQPDRKDIIDLLLHLAIGYEDESLWGFDAERIRKEQTAWRENPHRVDLIGPYDAVCAAGDALIALARDDDPEVRSATLRTLGFLPDLGDESVVAIRFAVDHDSDATVVASALLALGLLLQQRGPSDTDRRRFMRLFESSTDWGVRFAAAVGLVRTEQPSPSDEAVGLLVETITNPPEREIATSIGWNGGDMAGLAAIVLGWRQDSLTTAKLTEMATALRESRGLSAVRLVTVLLNAVAPRDGQTWPQHATDLTDRQQVVIASLGTAAGWWAMEGAGFANFSMRVRDYGLPGRQEGIKRWLDGTNLTDCLRSFR